MTVCELPRTSGRTAGHSPWSGWYLCLHSSLEPGHLRNRSPHTQPNPHHCVRTQNKGFSVASTLSLETLISAAPYLGWGFYLGSSLGRKQPLGQKGRFRCWRPGGRTGFRGCLCQGSVKEREETWTVGCGEENPVGLHPDGPKQTDHRSLFQGGTHRLPCALGLYL